MLTEMSRKETEVLEIVEVKWRAGWKDWTKERKESRCSRESEVAPIMSSI